MRSVAALILGTCLAATSLYAQGNSGNAKGKGKGHKKASSHTSAVNKGNGRFGANDLSSLRQYYGAHPVNLPPGLQKKLARGKPLPPGWQKKLQPFPANLDAGMGPLCGYCGRGVIDGYGVIYDKRTAIIMDVVSLVGNVLR